jgi:PhnB protein
MIAAEDNTMFITTLFFNGRCQEAIDQYQKAFGADVAQLVPFSVDSGKKGIEHSQVFIHNHRLWLSDDGGEQGPGACIVFDDLASLTKAFEVMKEGGQVLFGPQATPFSICEAILKDRFGLTWGFIVYDQRTFPESVEKAHQR